MLRLPSPIPQAEFVLAADALSAFFLVPIFLISLLGSIYGLDYWKQTEHPDNGRKLRMFYGLLTAALAVLVLARNSVTFLFGWESMAVSAFFLVAHRGSRRTSSRRRLALSRGQPRGDAVLVRDVRAAVWADRQFRSRAAGRRRHLARGWRPSSFCWRWRALD